VITRILAVVFSVLILANCSSDGAPIPTLPSPPVPPPVVQNSAVVTNWSATSLVVTSDDGNACGGTTLVGATSKGIEWRITTEAAAILLEVDMSNYPVNHMRYAGTSSGLEFTGAYETGAEYLDFFCELRAGRLRGFFSSDHSTFDATETLIWGPATQERTVTRHWTGSKR
jgi:hypothetical protein